MTARRHDLAVGKWGARFLGRHLPCAIGRGGISAKKVEGDGVTPVGAYRIEWVWARPERVHVRAPALTVLAPGLRDGWSEDPDDPAYNTLVRRPHGSSHEIIRRGDGLYDICCVIDHNRRPVTPGAGSAIFIHLWRRPRYPTAGCVAFARKDLQWILARWKRDSRLVIQP